MISFEDKTPLAILKDLAYRVRQHRLAENLTQEGLAKRSGVSFGSLKRFEKTGQISLESLIKLAIALNCEADFETLFAERQALPSSLDEILSEPPTRKRGRRV